MKTALRTLAALGLIASPAATQDAPGDWQIMSDPSKQALAAVVAFDSGIGVGVRCMRGGLGVILTGLPPQSGDRRLLRMGYDDQPLRDSNWVPTADPTAAVHEYPARIARRMRQGGALNIVVPGAGEGGRNLRYILDLPPSATAIESVLTACNKPLVDPRDAELDVTGPAGGLPANMRWTRAPSPIFPHEAEFDGVRGGYAVVSCNTQTDGTLKACEVESEHPLGSGFGRASLAAVDRARVGWTRAPGAAVDVRRVAFRVSFRS